MLNLAGVFRAKVIDISTDAITVETTGSQEKVDALLGLLSPLGIRDLVRTGPVAIPRIGAAREAPGAAASLVVPEAESAV